MINLLMLENLAMDMMERDEFATKMRLKWMLPTTRFISDGVAE